MVGVGPPRNLIRFRSDVISVFRAYARRGGACSHGKLRGSYGDGEFGVVLDL
jgi:hypothetical protein